PRPRRGGATPRGGEPGPAGARPRHEETDAEQEARAELGEGDPGAAARHPRGGAHRAGLGRRTLAGPGTVSSSPVTIRSGWVPPAQAAAVSVSRWASAGTATALTSSGVT